MNLYSELDIAINAAKKAGEYLKNLNSDEIIVLSSVDKDIKLNTDKVAEKIIFNCLKNSNYKILAEEGGKLQESESPLIWIVDPLDGSMNFSRGIPDNVVSIALWDRQKPLLGVIYDYNRDELYSGIVGIGAWMNDKKINVSNIQEKNKGIVYSGFPSETNYSTEKLLKFVKKIQDFKKIRLIGSAALSLAYIACGKAEAYMEEGIMLWDVAAGLAIVKAAGGMINFKELDSENKCNVLASNGLI